MSALKLLSPLAGWVLPLEAVPDPVFAGRMAGDGIAIDPLGDVLHAPCDGELVPMEAAHAVTLRTTEGVEILMHVGIDTVHLKGAGFEALARAGEPVRAGQPLLRFDLARVVRTAKSAVTPILLAGMGTGEGAVVARAGSAVIQVGDWLMDVAHGSATAAPRVADGTATATFTVPFDHGIHARPAALLAAALKPYRARVTLSLRGRDANAHSTVSLMSLAAKQGETVEARAQGDDAAAAIAALGKLLSAVDTAAAAPAAPLPTTSPKPVARTARPAAESRISGVVASRGVVMGPAAQLTEPEIEVVEAGQSHAQESAALASALARVHDHLAGLLESAGDEQRTILAAHAELIQDPELADRANDWMSRGKSAGYAWRQAMRSVASALHAAGDDHMAERVADLRDLENQVLRVLSGRDAGHARTLPENAILLADELLPSQLITLDRTRIAGICTARGGPTSHVAIIAAAMGIPALVAAGPEVLEIADGAFLVLNAEHGHLHVEPAREERERIARDVARRTAENAADLAAAREAGLTRDGVHVQVFANLGAQSEAAGAMALGAEGCGLLRSEFLFLDRRDAPGEDEQAREYQAIADALAGQPLTIRTLDIGGDKPIPYLPLPREDNPALGLRGLRTSLWQPELLRTQLRAILRVRPAAQCRVLLPMVTDINDVRLIHKLIEELANDMGLAIIPALGVMIETPASALLADQLAREADFLSIGTNDLSQYVLAMDRGHPALAARLDALHPAVLRLIATTASAARAAGKEVAVCGGLAADSAAIPLLVGLGVHELSVVPAVIPRVKRILRSLDARAAAALAERALQAADAGAVRALVAANYPGEKE